MPGLTVTEPRGAFYAFPRLGACLGMQDPATGRVLRSGADLVEVLLEADQVATIAGEAFGTPEALRLSFAAADEVLEEALGRMAARLAALRQA
jgi:aspartate aminotransferase